MGVFKADHAAIASLVHEPFVRENLHRRADRVVRAAQERAPVESGRYRDSIHKEDGPNGMVLIVSDLEYAVYIEYGTHEDGHSAHHVIGGSLDAARDV